jgi:hypothetical protein
VRKAFEPGEITLGNCLLFAFLARLPAVFFSRGYHFLDHQFHYIDPAYYIAFDGSWYLPQEYVLGLRSWVYPGILAGIFKAIGWIGITEPNRMMIATRFVHGLISLVPVAALWMLIVRWKGWSSQRPLLLFFACNAFGVYTAVQPTGLAFAAGLSLTAIFLFHGPCPLWPLLSGLLLGLAFSCRFQDAFFGPVLLVFGLVEKRWRACVCLCLGVGITVTVQGLVDVFTWGSFLHSPFRYVAWNFFEGHASRFSVEPVWLYLAHVCGVLILVPPFVRSAWGALVKGGRRLPVVLTASVFYIFMHSLVGRKQLRFIYPALILLLVAYASALLYQELSESRLRTVHRRLFVIAHLIAFVFVSFWYPNRGAVEAALALGRQEDFKDQLVVVDGGPFQMGGHYYLNRSKLKVQMVKREELGNWLRQERPATPLYLLVVREPLEEGAVPDGYRLDKIGAYHEWPDFAPGGSRYVYCLRKAGTPKQQPSQSGVDPEVREGHIKLGSSGNRVGN